MSGRWTPNSVPARHPSAVDRLVDGEAVIVLPEQGTVKVLNEVGSHVWSLIDGQRTVTDIAEAICAEYEVSADQALQDILDFLAELEARGAVVPANTSQAG